MLVLDVADDFLDHVLDRHQPLGPAKLIDDDREVGSLGAHPREKIDHAHRFGHEQGRAQKGGHRAVAAVIHAGDEHILDVDHADHFIEAFAEHRQAAVAGFGEGGEQVIES